MVLEREVEHLSSTTGHLRGRCRWAFSFLSDICAGKVCEHLEPSLGGVQAHVSSIVPTTIYIIENLTPRGHYDHAGITSPLHHKSVGITSPLASQVH